MMSMILAMDDNNLVGNSKSPNGIPWSNSYDMHWFKNKTKSNTVVMGHETFKIIGKPLPGRFTAIMTRDETLKVDRCTMVNSVEEVVNMGRKRTELFIAGGPTIYRLLQPYCKKIYLSRIHGTHEGDVYFEDFSLEGFKLKNKKEFPNKSVTIYTYVRKV